MSRARVLAAIAIAAGLALGSVAAPPPPAVPLSWHGFQVIAADFHVHGFPDGIPPWDAAREATRQRLDAIALTSHNSSRGWWLWTHAPRSPEGDLIVLPGEELTSASYHMALVGVPRPVDWRQTIEEVSAAAHAQGGAAILAHPAGWRVRRVATDAALRAIDGIEVAHPAVYESRDGRADVLAIYQRAVALRPALAAIGSSDYHYVAPIGQCRTYLFVRERSPDGVIEALRGGRTVGCNMRGDVEGPAELSAVVAARCREDSSPIVSRGGPLSRTAKLLLWTGLLLLVIAGVRRP